MAQFGGLALLANAALRREASPDLPDPRSEPLPDLDSDVYLDLLSDLTEEQAAAKKARVLERARAEKERKTAAWREQQERRAERAADAQFRRKEAWETEQDALRARFVKKAYDSMPEVDEARTFSQNEFIYVPDSILSKIKTDAVPLFFFLKESRDAYKLTSQADDGNDLVPVFDSSSGSTPLVSYKTRAQSRLPKHVPDELLTIEQFFAARNPYLKALGAHGGSKRFCQLWYDFWEAISVHDLLEETDGPCVLMDYVAEHRRLYFMHVGAHGDFVNPTVINEGLLRQCERRVNKRLEEQRFAAQKRDSEA
jgi:hypothetical protein